jgi:hypothetical protein
MTPVKIQCGCGQRYAFDVELVDGRMATAVACPVCGADGTAAANEVIARTLTAQTPPVAPGSGLRLSTATAAPPLTPSPMPSLATARPPLTPRAVSAKLAWYEQIWIALPIALVGFGGAIGGACGGAAWVVNKTVFKKLENPVLKYLVTGIISASAVIVWLVVASFFVALLKKR